MLETDTDFQEDEEKSQVNLNSHPSRWFDVENWVGFSTWKIQDP